jgi:acetolactate synthase-1/2/3 large subunit
MAEDTVHGGRLVARALRAAGVRTLFTLSGGHLFSVYDGCLAEGIKLVDTRHEQTAAFAAEATALIPLVTPGPAVSAQAPSPRVTFDQPSAANAAVCSWRVSTSLIPSARQPS